MEVGVESIDVERQLQRFAQYPQITRKHLVRGMTEATVEMQSKWQREAPVDTRRYVTGISRKVDNKIGGEVVGVVATSVTSAKGFPYPAALEEGAQYHYRRGPRRGQPTMGHLKRAVKNAQKGIDSAFKRAIDRITKALVVR